MPRERQCGVLTITPARPGRAGLSEQKEYEYRFHLRRREQKKKLFGLPAKKVALVIA